MNPAEAKRAPLQGLVPGAFLAGYVAASRSVGIDPYAQLRRARLPTSRLDDERAGVRLEDFLALVARTGGLAQRTDFVLCLASALNLAALGPIGLLASAQSSVREGLRALSKCAAGPARLIRATLVERGETGFLKVSFANARGPCASELALGLGVRVMQGLVGPAWRPGRTILAGPRPAASAPYEAFFGEVEFGGPIDALIFDAAALERAPPLASPALARLLEHHLQGQGALGTTDFADQVLELIEALLPRGLCKVELIAEQFGVDRRTVHRRLAAQGLSFSALTLLARRRIVEGWFEEPDRPISAVGQSVGLSGGSAFSRWFHRTYGVSPSQFRQRSPR